MKCIEKIDRVSEFDLRTYLESMWKYDDLKRKVTRHLNVFQRKDRITDRKESKIKVFYNLFRAKMHNFKY